MRSVQNKSIIGFTDSIFCFDGVKMSKALGNEFVLDDVEAFGIEPIAFRYLCLTIKYRTRLNLTFAALKAAQRGLTRLRDRISGWKIDSQCMTKRLELNEFEDKFWSAVKDDLNLPKALSIVWDLTRSQLPDSVKLDLVFRFDKVLGLGLIDELKDEKIPRDVMDILELREKHRKISEYVSADQLRLNPRLQPYEIRDMEDSVWVRPKTNFELSRGRWDSISSSKEVTNNVAVASLLDFSFVITACNYLDDVQRCIRSILKWAHGYKFEIILVDNGSNDGTGEWAEQIASTDFRVKTIHCDHQVGEAQTKNIGLKKSLGQVVIMIDTSIEITGDILPIVWEGLASTNVGVLGPWGLVTEDLNHFHEEVDVGEVDAMQGYFFSFRRDVLNQVGLMRECFRFYRNLDLDFSFQFKDKGYSIIADGTLSLSRHTHRQWSILSEDQRDNLSRKNFGHFLNKWKERHDMLVANQGRD